MTKFEQYQSVMGRINYVLFLVAVAALPFPQITLRYTLVAWLVAWVLELRFLKKPSINRTSFILPFVLFAIWYAWRALTGLWSPDHRAWSFMMERYMTFALILPVGIWGVNEHYNWHTAAKVLAISAAVSVPFYCIANTALYIRPDWVQYLGYRDWSFSYNNWIECFTANGSYMKHRLFWCTTQLVGTIAAVQVWRKKPQIWIPLALVSLSAIPLTGSRQMIISLAAVITIAIIYFLSSLKIKRSTLIVSTVLTILVILAIGTLAFIHHPRMKEILQGDVTINHLVLKEPRVAIWQQALSSPKDYFWKGLGGGQSVKYLEAKYNAHYMEYYSLMHYHAHNQYLEELMELGIFGMLLFIIAWISIIVCAKGKGRQTAIYFVTISMLNMLTDCMWGKFDGIALWAIVMIFILIQSKSTEIERK